VGPFWGAVVLIPTIVPITMPTPNSSPQLTPNTKDLFFIMIPFAVVLDKQHTR
jgi:hypothetical protein